MTKSRYVPLRNRALTSVAAIPLVLAGRGALAVDLHFATGGDDSGPGTEARSFATLERARDEIRRLKAAGTLPDGGVAVRVRGGDYEPSRPLELTDADSRPEAASSGLAFTVMSCEPPGLWHTRSGPTAPDPHRARTPERPRTGSRGSFAEARGTCRPGPPRTRGSSRAGAPRPTGAIPG
jgi:hypothetical protein